MFITCLFITGNYPEGRYWLQRSCKAVLGCHMGVLLTRGCWCNYPPWMHIWACTSQWACTWTCTEGFNAACFWAYCPVVTHVWITLGITMRMGKLCVRSMALFTNMLPSGNFTAFYKKNSNCVASLIVYVLMTVKFAQIIVQFLLGRIWRISE